MKHLLLICCVLFLCRSVQCAFSGEDTSRLADQRPARLLVRSDVPDVRMYIDSAFVGVTPLVDVAVHKGIHILRYLHPNPQSWTHPVLIETLVVLSSDTIQRQVYFPILYHVTSEPYGAIVSLNDSVLGSTPLVCSLASAGGTLTLSREGYKDAAVALPAGGGEVYALLDLNPEAITNGTLLSLTAGRSKNMQPVVLTAGVSVLAGAASAYFKIRADGYYDDYRTSGDQGTLDRVRRLDRAAGITLITSELSLLALSYLLLSR